MAEEIRRINGVELCVESFGSPDGPCILLIMGAMASMIWWDTRFCLRLAKQGRFVIRYDNRDVGRSTWYPPGEMHYSFHDLVDDSVAVLDSFGVRKAHFAGMSLGGMIAQGAALRYPDRVLSITAIASGIFDDRPDLPPISEKVLAYHNRAAKVDWENAQQVKEYLVSGWKLLAGTRHAFDEDQAMALADVEMQRAGNLRSMFNHAQLTGGEELYGRVNTLRLPALVIHGTEDPVLPLPHGKAIADAIPGARLVTLEGAGHELHKNDWDLVIAEMAALTDENRKNGLITGTERSS